MPVYRIKDRKGRPFVQVDKVAVEDVRLSWKAKGILLYLLSKPDSFIFYLDELSDHATDGIDSLRSGIKELQDLGYVKRYAVKEKGRIVSWNMDVYEAPFTTSDFSTSGKTISGESNDSNNDLNNNDLNKNDKRYIFLTENADSFINIYEQAFKRAKRKEHMKVTSEQLQHAINQIEYLKSFDITEKEWEEGVIEHFDNLPKKNNGNILSFIETSPRYFEVPMYNTPEGYY